MSLVGQLQSGSRPQGLDCLIACRNRHVRSCSRSLVNAAFNQVAVAPVRDRTVSSFAANGSATAQPAAPPTQYVSAAAAVASTSQQAGLSLQQQQQRGQEALQPPSWQQQPQSRSSGGMPSSQQQQQHRQRVDMTAVQHPELVTAAISSARSIAQLQKLVHKHGTRLNHIHISAAFVQLQRLWNSSSTDNSPVSINGSSSQNSGISDLADRPAARRSLLLQLQQLAQSLPRVDGRYCANVLHSLAAIKQQGEAAAYCPPLVDQLCAASFELVNTMPPQELATLVWSLAMLDTLPAPQLLNRLVANVLRRLAAFRPQDLIMTLSGLPRLTQQQQVAPYSTVHKLAAAAAQQMHAASPLECALLLLTLANVTYRPNAAWLSNYYSLSQPKLSHMCASGVGMLGLGLGQMASVSEPPPVHWLTQYEQQLIAVCIHGQQQHQHEQHQHSQQQRQDHDRSIGSSSSTDGHMQQPAALVELVMGLYGWSRAAPEQPPSPDFQQLLFTSTQQMMDTGSGIGSSHCLTVQQRQQQQQQRRHGQFSNLQQLQQQSVVSLQTSIQQHWQQSVVQQQQHQDHGPDEQITNAGGISPRLLVELLAAAARWRLVPPRSWLLSALRNLQHHLTAGACSSRDIANLLWALATLGVKPNAAWLDCCTEALQQHYQQQLLIMKQQHQQKQQRPWRREGGLPVAAAADEQSWHQQQLNVAKQLSVCLWSLNRLQHQVTSHTFWPTIWSTTQPLFIKKFRLTDIAMTLEGVKQQQQQPPGWWIMAALKAAVKKAAGAAAELQSQPEAESQQQQQQLVKASKKRRPHAGVLVSSADCVVSDMMRVCAAAAALGAVPGHKWCDSVVQALQPAVAAQEQLDIQSLSVLIWSLGKLGYQPAGSSLAPWLTAAVTERTDFHTYSSDQLVLLLSGLRYSRVVMNSRWTMQLIMFAQQHAAELTLQVLVQVLLYVSAARLRPPAEWAAAMAAALEIAVEQQQPGAHQFRLEPLLGALARLHVVPSSRLMQQLEHSAAAASADAQMAERVQQRLQRLRSMHDAAATSCDQQPVSAVAQQQGTNQVQQDSTAVVTSEGRLSGSSVTAHQGIQLPEPDSLDSRSGNTSGTAASSSYGNSSSRGSSSSSLKESESTQLEEESSAPPTNAATSAAGHGAKA